MRNFVPVLLMSLVVLAGCAKDCHYFKTDPNGQSQCVTASVPANQTCPSTSHPDYLEGACPK